MSYRPSTGGQRRVNFAECTQLAPEPSNEMVPESLPVTSGFDIPPQNARHEPFQLGSGYLTVERLSTNGARPPLTRQYVDDPTLDPSNQWWQEISSRPDQQYGRARMQELIRHGERLRPEVNSSREPWQRAATLTRMRPPAKISGIVTERSRSGEDDAIYAMSPDSNMQFPDCTGNPADLAYFWKSVSRQPHERPKKVFDKSLVERYPAVYGPNGVSSPILNPSCPPPPQSSSLKPFPDHSIMPQIQIRPWTARM